MNLSPTNHSKMQRRDICFENSGAICTRTLMKTRLHYITRPFCFLFVAHHLSLAALM